MATREGIIAALKAKGYTGPEVQASQNTGITGNADLDLLIQQSIGKRNIGNRVGDAISILGGGKPPESDDYSKLIAQEAIKKQFNRSPYDDLIEKAKAVDAAKSTGNRTLYDTLLGNQTQESNPPVSTPTDNLTGIVAPEIDPFTGKESTRGLQQKTQNEIIQQSNIAKMKSKLPTANQKDQLAKVQNVETLVNDLEKLSDTVPSGYGGLYSQGEAFLTRGNTQTNTVLYNDQRKAIAVAVYRALTGDTRLSDADAASRALPLLWKPDEGEAVKKAKFNSLKQLLSKAKQTNIQNQGGIETEGEDLSSIDAELADINRQLGIG